MATRLILLPKMRLFCGASMDTSSPAYHYARRIEKENRLSSGEKIIVKAYLTRILAEIKICDEEDGEYNAGGNGINSFEAHQLIKGLIVDMSRTS